MRNYLTLKIYLDSNIKFEKKINIFYVIKLHLIKWTTLLH